VRRVLVANRGEIASRIIRTLDRMGVESVAVHADVDRATPHVTAATHAVALDGPSPAAAYRDAEQLLAIALATSADGVHPGYGFLAEDGAFAAAVEEAGLAFIGPTPAQIALFGDKHRARAVAIDAGVPMLPGSDGLGDADAVCAAAASIGLPVMVKSTAGGGGIGMTACRRLDELPGAVATTMRRGAALFGAPTVLVERLVERARHVEVQVFGDGDGRVLVLADRDCSLQRRRQKVLEEAPAPGLDPAIRAQLHDAAVRLVEPMRYRSAGTVEFLVDVDRGEVAFLEVNTRLQVEHPVTEAVLDIDLVEWMVRLAAGDRSFLPAAAPVPSGHAIEARLYAEDPAKEYLPSVGTLTRVQFPPGVRVDGWVRAGTEVTPHFDPLLAKVIVHGRDRADAVAKLRAVLDETRIDGIETNRALLAAVLADEAGSEGGALLTSTLEAFPYSPATIDVLDAGGSATVHDLPGRLGYWEVGVPPSGPIDDRSFAVGNELLGNAPVAPGLECVAGGPTLCFNAPAWICLTGAPARTTLDGAMVPWCTPLLAPAGSELAIGGVDDVGMRTYLLVRGGLDVPSYLGSATTFTLGGFGGHGGRALQVGDVLHLTSAASEPPPPDVVAEAPDIVHRWEVGVLDGPHAAPEFFTRDDIEMIYGTEWEVHYQSSRTGVRLVGPKPEWARNDGGSAGLHPSNIHDTPYVPGTLDFTGDMPIILGPDGPSLGGFVCPVTIVTDEQWKIGQLAAGDRVRFVRRGEPDDGILATTPEDADRPAVTYRRAGDRAVLVEFGPMVLDFDLRLRAHALATAVADARLPGVIDVTPGIRALQVRFDDGQSVESMLGAIREIEPTLPATRDLVVPSRTVRLPLSWDDPSTREAIARYMRVVRDDAPWCPWNIEFIRRINGLASVEDVHRIVFDAEYLVLGLGDVYLGAPVAVPTDPRHRLVTTKYNPARTWTPENAVGIGGAYLCIYGMEGPGGYQFVGRTVPVWSRFGEGARFDPETPWLLRHFDRIRWTPVEADELLDLRADAHAGRLDLEICESEFSAVTHRAFVAEHADSIVEFEARRSAAYAEERAAWVRSGEFDRADEAPPPAARSTAGHAALAELPTGASVLASPLAGSVARVHRAAKDPVRAGEPVVTVEAMKMEHSVLAPDDAIVERVVCGEGDLVSTGAPLAVLIARG
jgi:urea carboxylase